MSTQYKSSLFNDVLGVSNVKKLKSLRQVLIGLKKLRMKIRLTTDNPEEVAYLQSLEQELYEELSQKIITMEIGRIRICNDEYR